MSAIDCEMIQITHVQEQYIGLADESEKWLVLPIVRGAGNTKEQKHWLQRHDKNNGWAPASALL